MEFSLYGKPPSSAAITSIRLERREPARNRLRFYTIAVTRTLFDGWAVVREWGRIGQPGTVREAWFETESAAIEAGAKVRERKEERGYRALADTKKKRNLSCPDDNLA
jgi:predicted DNA-binding WGR domain protein